MPQLSDLEMNMLLKELKELKNRTPLTLNVNSETEKQAEVACNEYLKKGNIEIRNLSPLSVYFIISKLSENEQIKFINENIKYIKENDDNVFLYTMLEPKSLSYFLSLKVLEEINSLDHQLFKKIISQNHDYLFHGFSHDDYCKFYNDYYQDILEIQNFSFLDGIYSHNRCCYNNIKNKNLNNLLKLQHSYNREFMTFILEKYIDKILTFDNGEMLRFISYIDDSDLYKKFIIDNHSKVQTSFEEISEYRLNEYLSEYSSKKQDFIFSLFFEDIIKKHSIKKIMSNINPDVITKLYYKDQKVFADITINDWLEYCSTPKMLTDGLKRILDAFEINDIKSLFDTNFYLVKLSNKDVTALKYIELKYRDNLKITGTLEKITSDTSIFSEEYLKNLKEFKEMLAKNVISTNNEIYQQHLLLFLLFLQTHKNINAIPDSNFREIEKLFYKIVKGKSLTLMYQFSTINEIALLNRIGSIEFNPENFTVEQIQNYNVKLHKKLYKDISKENLYLNKYKSLILKLFFMIGFNNTKKILNIDSSLTTLEHLAGNVDVKNVSLDEQGTPILNERIINIVFNSQKFNDLEKILINKDNDVYKYFPRIFNEWEMITLNGKDKSFKTIVDFLKSEEISLPPKYYRLKDVFKIIGSKNTIVDETLLLHDQILARTSSSIPRVMGTINDYSYEILKLDDMEALAVGSKTACCFTVLGNAYSSLKHATTSKNGRVFIIRKDGELLAHSWIWRNGDLVCFDNIEISKRINKVDFLEIYLQASDQLLKLSFEQEGIDNCIKNVTVGFTEFDNYIDGIEDYPCFIKRDYEPSKEGFLKKLGKNINFLENLPQPYEEVEYSDSKNVQYLLRGNGLFHLGQIEYNYLNERNDIMYYNCDSKDLYDENYLDLLTKKVNSLMYIKQEKVGDLSEYKTIELSEVSQIYCNDDWYEVAYLDGTIEKFNNDCDERALEEINQVSLNDNKVLKKEFEKKYC